MKLKKSHKRNIDRLRKLATHLESGELVRQQEESWVSLVAGSAGKSMRDAKKFFGLSGDACEHLFVPYGQDVEQFGGRVLGGYASAEQVAENIRALVHMAELGGTGIFSKE